MKVLASQLKIRTEPLKNVELDLTNTETGKSQKRPGYIGRQEMRDMVIDSGIYSLEEVEKIEKTGCGKIVLNLMETSPFSGFTYLLSQKESAGIIKGLEFFITAFGSEVGIVFVPKKNTVLMEYIVPLVRKTPNVYVRRIYDRYPLGIEEVFARRQLRQRGNYFPGKNGTLIISPIEAFRLYDYYKKAVSGKKSVHIMCVLNRGKCYYVRAEKNMSIKYILDKTGIGKEGFIIAGDPLSGVSVTDTADTVSGKNIITVFEKYDIALSECFRCGRCIQLCPVFLRKPRSRISFEKKQGIVPPSIHKGCVGCGLCGYFCPGWLK